MSVEHPVLLLLLLPATAATLLAWRGAYFHLSRRHNLAVLAVRFLLLTAVVLGLAGVSRHAVTGRQAVLFVADLSASNRANRSAMEQFINGAFARQSHQDIGGVVTDGADALVDSAPGPQTGYSGFQSIPDPNQTDLAAGVQLAASLLPPGYRHRVVLLTDGRQTVGDALQMAALLHRQGVRIDVVPQSRPAGNDVRVDGVEVPPQVQSSQRFSVTVTLHASASTTTRLDIYRDGVLALSTSRHLPAGSSHFVFPQPPLHSGLHRYRVVVTPRRDSVPQNNSGSAFTQVQGATHVLIVAAVPAEAQNVVASVRAMGVAADLRSPEQLTPSLTWLEGYAGVVIVDTPAPLLQPTFASLLVPFVRDLGRGLVVIGGRQSYGLGGYGQTPLEQVLPVKMDLPRRKDLPTAAVALVIESLEAAEPVNISKAAGKGVVDLLTEQDEITVNDTPNNNTSGVAVPLQHPRDKAAIARAIDGMAPGDPGTYFPYLLSAFRTIRTSKAPIKHIILLGDGDAQDNRYVSLVQRIHRAGVTVSTVITNGSSPSDFATMRHIAHWGGGRYYRADDPSAVPRIFVHETRTISRSGIINGRIYPTRVSRNPIVNSLRTIPALSGYIATEPKPAAEVVLTGQKGDPVLATWQFGLGRSVAWTSDAAGLWTRDWLASRQTSMLWARMVSWTLPARLRSTMYVAASAQSGRIAVSAVLQRDLGARTQVTARVVDPGLHASVVALQPGVSGTYKASFAAPASGTYMMTVQAHGVAGSAASQVGVSVPYSAEYRTAGADPGFLQALARAGGGSVLSRSGQVWANNAPAVFSDTSLTALLWLLAALLLPVDIGLRRLVVGRRNLRARRPVPTRSRQVVQRPPAATSRVAVQPRPVMPAPVPGKPVNRPVVPHSPPDSTVGRLLAAKRQREMA